METLAPPLECLIQIKHGLHCGRSIRAELKDYCANTNHPFAIQLKRWILLREQNPLAAAKLFSKHNEYRQTLIELIDYGLEGQPILDRLVVLESELKKAAQLELETHLATLPFKMLIPLFCFIFPALLLLVLEPLVIDLVDALSH